MENFFFSVASEMKNIFLINFGDAELANDGGCCFITLEEKNYAPST